jgi:glycosyltransferase 2 family protein
MKINKWLVASVGILISALFLWLAFRNLNPLAVWEHIRQVDSGWLLVGSAVYFIGVALISLRWLFLLRSIKAVPLRSLIPIVSIGYMGNNVYPFRSGEVLRVILLQRQHQMPVARAATTVVVERAFDGIVMLSFIAVSLLFVNITSADVKRVTLFATPIFLTAVAFFFLLATRPNVLRQMVALVDRFLPRGLRRILDHLAEEVIQGLEGLRSPADLAGAVVCSFASWMVEASVYWMVSFAFNLNLGYPVMLLVVGVVNLAGLIPASPGQIGVFEFFVSLILIGVGVANAQAQAYALVVHVVIWLPVTLAGFFFLVRQGLGWSTITHAREMEQRAASG